MSVCLRQAVPPCQQRSNGLYKALEEIMATNNKLDILRSKAAEVRDVEHQIADLEQQLKEKRARLQSLCRVELPDLMTECGTDHIGIPANGNMAAYDAVLRPFYKANIAASWSSEKQQAAFNWLVDNGFGDLIKTEVDVQFTRDQYKKAERLVKMLKTKGFKPEFLQRVHHGVLTAWLQEQIEQGHLPPLDVIGGEVGRVVVLKERRT